MGLGRREVGEGSVMMIRSVVWTSNEMLSIVRYLRCLWLPPLLQFRWWRWWEGSVMMIRSVVWTSNEMLSIVRHLRRLWLPPLLFNSR